MQCVFLPKDLDVYDLPSGVCIKPSNMMSLNIFRANDGIAKDLPFIFFLRCVLGPTKPMKKH